MHDKHGRMIEVGDWVKIKPFEKSHVVIGRVIRVVPDPKSSFCVVAWPEIYVDLGSLRTREQRVAVECRATEIMLKTDGSEPPVIEEGDDASCCE